MRQGKQFGNLTLVFALSLFLVAPALRAELVCLKNGKKLDGRIISKSETSVQIDCGGSKLIVPTSRIDRIESASAPPETGNALEPMMRLEKAGKTAEAYAGYETYLSGADISNEARQTALDRLDNLLAGETAKIERRFSAQIAAGDFARCISDVRRERTENRVSSFEERALLITEANFLVRSAQREIDRGNPAGALKELQQAETLDVDCPQSDATMGSVLLDLGEAQRAVPYLKKACAKAPDDACVAGELIVALCKAGQGADAAALWESRRKDVETSPIGKEAAEAIGSFYRTQAVALHTQGNQDEAVKVFEKGYDIASPSARLYDEGYRFYTLANDTERAARMKSLLDGALSQSSRQGVAQAAETPAAGRSAAARARSTSNSCSTVASAKKGLYKPKTGG